jgi:hypothetical protein
MRHYGEQTFRLLNNESWLNGFQASKPETAALKFHEQLSPHCVSLQSSQHQQRPWSEISGSAITK